METKLNIWLSRVLTLMGRFLLVKALGISKLIVFDERRTQPNHGSSVLPKGDLFRCLSSFVCLFGVISNYELEDQGRRVLQPALKATLRLRKVIEN